MIFISYALTGRDIEKRKILLKAIQKAFSNIGYEAFCAFDLHKYFDEKGIVTYNDRLNQCILAQKKHRLIVAFIDSDAKSNGMIAEREKAKEFGQKYLLLIKKGLEFNDFREFADEVVEFDDDTEIPETITTFKYFSNKQKSLKKPTPSATITSL